MPRRLLDGAPGVAVLVLDGASTTSTEGSQMVAELQDCLSLQREVRLVIIAVQNRNRQRIVMRPAEEGYVSTLPCLLQRLRGIQRVIFGLVDGHASSLATAVLSTCDFVVATSRTSFTHYKSRRVVTLEQARRSQLVHTVVPNVHNLHLEGVRLSEETLRCSDEGIREVKDTLSSTRREARNRAKNRQQESREERGPAAPWDAIEGYRTSSSSTTTVGGHRRVIDSSGEFSDTTPSSTSADPKTSSVTGKARPGSRGRPVSGRGG